MDIDQFRTIQKECREVTKRKIVINSFKRHKGVVKREEGGPRKLNKKGRGKGRTGKRLLQARKGIGRYQV